MSPKAPEGPFPLCFGDRSLPRTVLWGAVCPQPPLSGTPLLSRVSDTCRHTRTAAAQPSAEPWSCQLSGADLPITLAGAPGNPPLLARWSKFREERSDRLGL